MRMKRFLLACLLLCLTKSATAQTDITRFEESFKEIPVIKPIKILKTLTPEAKKEYHLLSLSEAMKERNEKFQVYPQLECNGLKSMPAEFGPVSTPGIEEIVRSRPEVTAKKGHVILKQSPIWSWSVPSEVRHSYITRDSYVDFSVAATFVLLPLGTKDNNPVLLYFDRRTGFKWSQRIPLQDCFKQLGIEEKFMAYRGSSQAYTMLTLDSSRIFVQLILDCKEQFLFVFDSSGSLLKTYVFPEQFTTYRSESGSAFYINARMKQKKKSPLNGKVIEESFEDVFFMDENGNMKARFEPFNEFSLNGPWNSYDDSYAAFILRPKSEGFALFDLTR